MIATEDIGEEVARRLVGGWAGRPVVELGSPVSPDDLAAAMTDVLGRAVRARPVPRDQWAASLAAQGVPADRTGPYKEMLDAFNSGWINFGVPGTVRVAATVTPAEVLAHARR